MGAPRSSVGRAAAAPAAAGTTDIPVPAFSVTPSTGLIADSGVEKGTVPISFASTK
jgi:hypothetical protein